MAYSLERLLFVSSTPRRIFTCGRQCLCCNGYSAVSGAEKAEAASHAGDGVTAAQGWPVAGAVGRKETVLRITEDAAGPLN